LGIAYYNLMESAKRMKVAEIAGEVSDIGMKVKLLSISLREVQGSKGPVSYHYGLLGDETGVIPFTAWSVPATVREKDVYEISKCYTKSYREKLRVYFDARTEFKLINEPMEVKRVYKFYNLKDLNINDKFVSVEGTLSGELKKEV
jgi:Single-stranded DNA-binding replication protein A (RPA), large (70 kD) subunit and related ssDNA-binding proteins